MAPIRFPLRTLALLSAAAVSASLAIAAPGSVTENAALGSTPQTCGDVHGTEEPAAQGGSYVIESVKNLVYLSVNQDTGTPTKWRERDFVQTAPIDLDGCLWTPIGAPDTGTKKDTFEGSFDGRGHPIDNLTVSISSFGGLFGTTDGARISGIVLRDVDITVSSGFAGAIAGEAFSTGIVKSSATGEVKGSSDYVGGLVGNLQSSSINFSFADVVIEGTGGSFHGGLAGSANNSSEIGNSFAKGNVAGVSSVGGLVGNVFVSTITNSYATSEVTGSANVGGLVGSATGELPRNSFWDTTASGVGFENTASGSAGGTGKTTNQMTSIDTFTDTTSADLDQAWPIVDGWQSFAPDADPTRVWGIRADLNGGYPFLLWEYDTTPEFACGPLDDNDFHQVSSVDHLKAVGVGGERSPCGLGDKYLQINDIDLVNAGPWTPIGTADLMDLDKPPFFGHYNGGNFTIHNMSIESEGIVIRNHEDDAFRILTPTGFFASLFDATVENLTISGAAIRVSDQVATDDDDILAAVGGSGILAGVVGNSTTLTNVHVIGQMNDVDYASGGLVGLVFMGGGIGDGDDDAPPQTTITNCSADVEIVSISEAEITLGGLVGAVVEEGSLDVENCAVTVSANISLAQQPQFLSVLFDGERDLPAPAHIGGAVGAVTKGSKLFLDTVTVEAASEINALQRDFDDSGGKEDTAIQASTVGGLVGVSLGNLFIENSRVGSEPTFSPLSDEDRVTIDVRASGLVSLGGLVGLTTPDLSADGQSGVTSTIESSSAVTTIVGSLGYANGSVGGLFGDATNSRIDTSFADVDMRIEAIYSSLLAGGLGGIFTDVDDPDSPIRHSSTTGSITLFVDDSAPNDSGLFGSLGGLLGVHSANSPVQDSWTSLDIRIDSLSEESIVNAGGAFGEIDAGSPVHNVLSLGTITLDPSVAHRTMADQYPILAGRFAGVVEEIDPDQEPDHMSGNFARTQDSFDLVGDGPSDGISGLSDTDITTITPYQDAGWSIVPASSSAPPAGPENEVWAWGNSGQCTPVLWWQWAAFSDNCLDQVVEPETDLTGPESGGDSDSGSGSGSGSTTPGSTNPGPTSSPSTILPPPPSDVPVLITPQRPGVSNEEVDIPDQPEDGVEPVTPEESDSSTDADALALSQENDAVGDSSGGVSTGMLWAIGLGGLGAAALLAGGVAFARMRP